MCKCENLRWTYLHFNGTHPGRKLPQKKPEEVIRTTLLSLIQPLVNSRPVRWEELVLSFWTTCLTCHIWRLPDSMAPQKRSSLPRLIGTPTRVLVIFCLLCWLDMLWKIPWNPALLSHQPFWLVCIVQWGISFMYGQHTRFEVTHFSMKHDGCRGKKGPQRSEDHLGKALCYVPSLKLTVSLVIYGIYLGFMRWN